MQTVAGTARSPSTSCLATCSAGGSRRPSEKLNIAGIGIGGQGGGVLRDMATENIVALCDVDSNKAAGTFKAFPKAEQFRDYRVLLDKQHDIDAVMIATPDHMHAPITVAALRAGKHVYVEKPMAHSIEEARVMTRVARETGLVTQMGNNGHAGEGLRLTREWLQAGAIGPVREIHCWSDRPGKWWVQNHDRPDRDAPGARRARLGPLDRRRPDAAVLDSCITPTTGGAWFDFGTGALGDMAIHNMDPAFYALDLGAPTAVEANDERAEAGIVPALDHPPVRVRRQGRSAGRDAHLVRRREDAAAARATSPDDASLSDNGIYFVGDKGTMVCGGWSGPPTLYPESRRKEFQTPPADDPPLDRAPPGVDQGVQGPQARGRQGGLRLFGPVHRGAPGGQPGLASPEADRMGRGQHEGLERPRGRRPDPQALPRRVRHRDLIGPAPG